MKELNIKLPIGILPVGTANDFAKYMVCLKMWKKPVKILTSEPRKLDIGKSMINTLLM